MKNEKTKRLVVAAVLSALIIVLQLVAGNIKLGPASITLVMAPVIVGSALYGRRMGAFLGFVFAFAVLIDPATSAFFAVNWWATVIIVLAKGILSAWLAACVYKLIAKKSQLLGVIGAGIVMPVVNTSIFVLGAAFFFLPVYAGLIPDSASGLTAIIPIISLTLVNFIVELAVNMVLSTGITTVVKATKKF